MFCGPNAINISTLNRIPIIFLQAVVVLIGIAALAFLLWEPRVEGVNARATNFEIYFKDPFLAYAYIASIPFFVALHRAFKTLGYVKQNKAFTPKAVKALRTIRYCALLIIAFVVVGEIIIMLNHGNDDPAGGVFMGILISFGSALMAAAATVFERVLKKGMGPGMNNE